MKAFLGKMSIGHRLILIFGLLITIPLMVVGTVSYQRFSDTLADVALKRLMELNGSLIVEINSIRTDNEEFSDKILSQGFIQAALNRNHSETDSTLEIEDKIRVEQILFSMTNPLKEANIFIVGKNGRTYRSNSDLGKFDVSGILKTAIYKRALESNGSNIWVPSNEDIFHYIRGEPFLYVVRRLNSLSATNREIGHSIIQFKYSNVSKVFDRLSWEPGEYITVIDSHGVIFYDNRDLSNIGNIIQADILERIGDRMEGVFITRQDNEQYLVSYKMHPGNGWSIIHGIPHAAVVAESKKMRDFTLIVTGICLVVAVMIAVWVANNIVRPIRNLKNRMSRIGDGKFEIMSNSDRQDEIGALQRSFNRMVEDIHVLMAKIEEDQNRKQMLELQKLEYQINPHFLYNTLDRIHWMLQKNGQNEQGEMVAALARYFRLGLSKGKETYTVKDELEHVQYYLYIMNHRSAEKFRVVVDADPEALHYTTLKIVLQPVVENAIKHAFREVKDIHEIRIEVKCDHEAVVYSVSDNGKGIAEQELNLIRNHILSVSTVNESRHGIGLSNINQRIRLTYGSKYGLVIRSKLGEGTTVTIRIPQRP